MRPIHFEIPADDPSRAQAFYSSVFGWQFHKWDGPMEYWMVKTGEGGPGIDGGMLKREGSAGVCNTVGVSDLDAVIASVTAHGGTVAMPKTAIPGVGWVAYCSDTEGNLFGLMQPESTPAVTP